MRRFLGRAMAVGLGLCILIGIPALSLSALYSLKYGECVRLPSGAEIGYEANVNFRNSFFIPDAVLRTAAGDIIAKEVSPIHLTEIAAFGWAWPEHGDDFMFIWTLDTGVVKEAENPDLYDSLSQDLGETYFGASKDMNVNTLWIFNQLKKQGRFISDQCYTKLLTW